MANLHHSRLLISKRPESFVLTKMRPPLLSSATHLERPGPPGYARLTGANARPPYGIERISYSYSVRLHSSKSGPGSKHFIKT